MSRKTEGRMTTRVSLSADDLNALERGLLILIGQEVSMQDRGWDKSTNADVRAMHAAALASHRSLDVTRRKVIKALARLKKEV